MVVVAYPVNASADNLCRLPNNLDVNKKDQNQQVEIKSKVASFFPAFARATGGVLTKWENDVGGFDLLPYSTGPSFANNVATFSGSSVNVIAHNNRFAPNTPLREALVDTVYLPDAGTPPPSGGFTCTGLDKITRGAYAGCWVVGNDGRVVQGDASPYNAMLIILSGDFTTVVEEFTLGLTASVQGVAIDTSGDTDTVWVADTGGKYLRHYNLYGESAGQEIVADQIDYSALTSGDTPNGLAYVKEGASLWVCATTSSTFREISVSSKTVVSTLSAETDADQLHYDNVNKVLYYSIGSNGVNGTIKAVLINDFGPSAFSVYTNMASAQAIEGFYIDREKQRLYVVNDGGYHTVATPARNVALVYKIPTLYSRIFTDKVCVTTLYKQNSGNTTSSRQVFGVGDVTATTGGWGLFIPGSTTDLRLIARNPASGASNVSWTWPNAANASMALVSLVVDKDDSTLKLYINGVEISASSATGVLSDYTGQFFPDALAVGGIYYKAIPLTARSAACDIAGLIVYTDKDERTRAEGALAWATNRVSLLPVGHPFKLYPPA